LEKPRRFRTGGSLNEHRGRHQTATGPIAKDIKRATRKNYSPEEKIRIVLDGLRGEDSIAELCRHEGNIKESIRKSSRKTSWRREKIALRAIQSAQPQLAK
jgi:transposase-like protein